MVITGDALCTIDLNSPLELVRQRPTLGYPPWITTWDWAAAKTSAVVVAALRPTVIAPGHGVPMRGAEASRRVGESSPATDRRASTIPNTPGGVDPDHPGHVLTHTPNQGDDSPCPDTHGRSVRARVRRDTPHKETDHVG